ncbi:hypothetical protein GUITHDRAFT_150081 [Guillardia theta CCMP2712]|uniref:Uncharacterized protein n=1 Tax=Guillardia theta (strain CCMP2712) TaxID=905079 RepID=L1K257_GUITC|nr:hypothetical protein GUITHDRAFT_150081 [Guillardia theta CCMP2712]EKX54664.1 hypothetical protein GUITHDRAFT_150081 [Guillardia theta CCMP2712]|eukprot:XP_005841644.1 hypothetical protein GUITHDRAFT_150081 [Guillardia theta CCMP2712]
MQLKEFYGKYGRLTRRYHGCWCVKWLDEDEAIAQALGQRFEKPGARSLCKLGSEYHDTWLCYVSAEELASLSHTTRKQNQ